MKKLVALVSALAAALMALTFSPAPAQAAPCPVTFCPPTPASVAGTYTEIANATSALQNTLVGVIAQAIADILNGVDPTTAFNNAVAAAGVAVDQNINFWSAVLNSLSSQFPANP